VYYWFNRRGTRRKETCGKGWGGGGGGGDKNLFQYVNEVF